MSGLGIDVMKNAVRRHCVLLVAMASLLAATSAAASAPVGFQVDVAAGRHLECDVFRRVLNCLQYGGGTVPNGAHCDFGGTVPTTKLSAHGRPRATFTCVDEGFHDWPLLRRGQAFRSGPFRCRLGSRSLSCSNGRHGFRIDRRGRVHRH